MKTRLVPLAAALLPLATLLPAVAPASAATPAPAVTAPTRAAAATVPAGLVEVRTAQSLLGSHTWYRQTHRGLPVLGGWYAVHTDTASKAATVADGRRPVPASLSTTPAVTAAAAGAVAKGKAGPAPRSTELAVRVEGPDARLVWRSLTTTPRGTVETLVDARSGAVVSRRDLAVRADGTGQVFAPNAVVALRRQGLTDQRDANAAVPAAAYERVRLTGLDGSGRLRGAAARILNADGATSPTSTFVYQRADDRFEQVMAYHGVTRAQTYLQSLGFTGARGVNDESQDVETNTIPDDNSYYDPSLDRITFGTGGVDDAEDLEIVWHEYGHAIQDAQVPGFGSSLQAGSIGEGFGDYWAMVMSAPVSGGYGMTCIGEWDATSYTPGTPHCLRRVDGRKTVDDVVGEVHADGEIWSRALFDIHRALGRRQASTLVVEAQFSYAPDTSFRAAATVTVSTAQRLYGSEAASAVRAAFVARGIL